MRLCESESVAESETESETLLQTRPTTFHSLNARSNGYDKHAQLK